VMSSFVGSIRNHRVAVAFGIAVDRWRHRFNAFVGHHDRAWELAMAALAVAYVAIGFASDDMSSSLQPALAAAEFGLTITFLLEFVVRFAASYSRLRYLRAHSLDLVALLPIARGLRIARVLRLLRLVRTFTGARRAFTAAERLSNHHELGTLVIAWFGTMFLCSSVFFAVESGVNPGINEPTDAVWWGIATLTGGTPEVHATTDEGRLASAVLLILGVALFTAITAALVSFLVSSSPSKRSAEARLRELEGLRGQGLITVEEYATARSGVVANLTR
jgi:voltage-gated potassium channel